VAPLGADGHVAVEHAPAEHVCPVAQARPQAPQFAGSVFVFTQFEPHSVVPLAQLHAPLTQL
jgi:hypothetical protein